MGKALFNMAMMAAFSNPDVPMSVKGQDTSVNRKARKERARELTRQREKELKGQKKK